MWLCINVEINLDRTSIYLQDLIHRNVTLAWVSDLSSTCAKDVSRVFYHLDQRCATCGRMRPLIMKFAAVHMLFMAVVLAYVEAK